MNIVAAKRSIPQLRCVCVSPFRYERMIKGRWVPCNHSRARGIVGPVRRKWGRV